MRKPITKEIKAITCPNSGRHTPCDSSPIVRGIPKKQIFNKRKCYIPPNVISPKITKLNLDFSEGILNQSL